MERHDSANRALRASVQSAFEARGYIDAEREPDMVVAVYARALDQFDLTQWPCGCPYSPGWWAAGLPANATGHDEGVVLVDVLDPQLVERSLATSRHADTRSCAASSAASTDG